MKTLAEIKDPQAIESGVFPGPAKGTAPLWAAGKNVIFREGAVEKMPGWEKLFSLSATPSAVVQAFADGAQRAYAGNATGLWKWEAGVLEQILTMPSGLHWSLQVWGNQLLAVDEETSGVWWWGNSGQAGIAPGSPSKASIIRAFNVHLMAFQRDGEPNRISWCSAGNPGLWTPALDNSAGGLNIRNISSPIRAAGMMGQYMAVYSADQMYLVQYVGGQIVFGYTEALAGIGAAGKNCLVPVGREHYGCERRGFWRTDGASSIFISEPALWTAVKDRINWDRGDDIYGIHNRELSLAEWYYPTVDGGFEGVAYNYSKGIWMPRDFRVNGGQSGTVFPGPIAAINEDVVVMNQGKNAGELPLAANIQTKPLALGTEQFWKYIDDICCAFEGNPDLEIGLQSELYEEVEWLPLQALTRHVGPERETVFLTLRFSSSALDAWWRVNQIAIDGELAGEVI